MVATGVAVATRPRAMAAMAERAASRWGTAELAVPQVVHRQEWVALAVCRVAEHRTVHRVQLARLVLPIREQAEWLDRRLLTAEACAARRRGCTTRLPSTPNSLHITMIRYLTAVLVTSALLLGTACQSSAPVTPAKAIPEELPQPLPQPPIESAARPVERFDGETWVLETTQRKQCENDLRVYCTGEIRVDGVLEAFDRPAGSPYPNGVTIRLVSETRIVVSGRVVAGNGGDAHAGPATIQNCLWLGGKGGDVILEAPEIEMTGTLAAGHAGRSGANAAGPAGGDVILRGRLLPDRGTGGMTGGTGGGFLGTSFSGVPLDGRGGSGGSVRLEAWSSATPRY